MYSHTELFEKSKQRLVQTSSKNMAKRLNEIIEIVRQSTPSSYDPFVIKKKNLKQMFYDLKNAILSWKGDGFHHITEKGYAQSSIQWFTKNSAKIYGNYFFYPLFLHILNFCCNKNDTDNNMRMLLFVTIILKIFTSTISSIGNKRQPLLPINCIVLPNKFKKILKQFISYFHVQCNIDKITPYTASKTIINAFSKIQQMLIYATNQGVEYNLFSIKSIPMTVHNKKSNKDINNKKSNSLSNGAETESVTSTTSTSPTTDPIPIKIENNQQSVANITNTNNYNAMIPSEYSIVVPLNNEKNEMIKYNIISFNPLIVEQNIM